MNVIPAIVIVALAIVSFCYLAWDLLSVWHARGWSGEDEAQTKHGLSGTQATSFKTYSLQDCSRYCLEHPYLSNVDAPPGCEEICRA